MKEEMSIKNEIWSDRILNVCNKKSVFKNVEN